MSVSSVGEAQFHDTRSHSVDLAHSHDHDHDRDHAHDRRHSHRPRVDSAAPVQDAALPKRLRRESLVPQATVLKIYEQAEMAETSLERAIHVAATFVRFAEFEANKYPELHLVAMFKLVVGVLLCFFGSHFSSVVAFAEAFSQGGGKELMENLKSLHDAIRPAVAHSDDDAKTMRVAMRIADPTLATRSVIGMYTACMSALVAIKLNSGRVVALGSSLGEHVDVSVQRLLMPSMLRHASPEVATWLPMAVHLMCRFIGVMVAFPLQMYLGVIVTSVRGGHLILNNLDELLLARGVQMNFAQKMLDDIVVAGIIATGMSYQFAAPLPTFLKVLLAPLLVAEFVLTTAVVMV